MNPNGRSTQDVPRCPNDDPVFDSYHTTEGNIGQEPPNLHCPTVCYQQRFDIGFGSFGSDASGTAWSVLCHRLRQAMTIAMLATFQHATQHAGTLTQDNPLRRFLISIAEHMVYVMAMLQ